MGSEGARFQAKPVQARKAPVAAAGVLEPRAVGVQVAVDSCGRGRGRGQGRPWGRGGQTGTGEQGSQQYRSQEGTRGWGQVTRGGRSEARQTMCYAREAWAVHRFSFLSVVSFPCL